MTHIINPLKIIILFILFSVAVQAAPINIGGLSINLPGEYSRQGDKFEFTGPNNTGVKISLAQAKDPANEEQKNKILSIQKAFPLEIPPTIAAKHGEVVFPVHQGKTLDGRDFYRSATQVKGKANEYFFVQYLVFSNTIGFAYITIEGPGLAIEKEKIFTPAITESVWLE